MYGKYFKRLFDLILSIFSLLILSPLLFLCYVLVKIDSKGPFFFIQDRIGKDAKVFKVYKIRTMTNKHRLVDKDIEKGDDEVTKVGYILRRLKLDELPQLINILKGEMSIVGPRPWVPSKLEDFNEDVKIRIKVRPGLTGLAQINGNIYLSWEDRRLFDRQYVEKLSFLLDLKIIFKTILIIILGEEKFAPK